MQLAALVGSVPGWSIVGQRDFNGDGKTDLLWRDTAWTAQATNAE